VRGHVVIQRAILSKRHVHAEQSDLHLVVFHEVQREREGQQAGEKTDFSTKSHAGIFREEKDRTFPLILIFPPISS
jgi:hypothetical protein